MTFCVSPGRCGTGYLASVLRAPGARIVHEPEPRFSEVGREAQFDPDVARAFWTERKLPAIDGQRHIETSHVFVNGFAETLLGLDVDAGLLAITRNHRDVALSLWRRRSIPARTGRGREFLRHPDAPSLRALPRKKKPDRWTDYQLCFWHCLEVEARQLWLESVCDAQGRPFRWLAFDDLFVRGEIEALVDWLELDNVDWWRYEQRKAWRVNANPEWYYDELPKGDLDEQEQEVRQWLP